MSVSATVLGALETVHIPKHWANLMSVSATVLGALETLHIRKHWANDSFKINLANRWISINDVAGI